MGQTSSRIDEIVASGLKMAKVLLTRAAVHFVSIGLAISIVGSWHVSGLNDIALAAAVYGGLISLIPYGSLKNPYWFIPVLAGLVLLAVLPLAGFPPALAVVAAGLLTWITRLVIARGNIGWDWTAAPVLALGLFEIIGAVAEGHSVLPLLAFPVLLALALVGYRMFRNLFHSNVHRQMLASSLVRLRTVTQSKHLSENELRHCRLLLSQSEALGLYKDFPENLVDRIVNITGELEDLVKTLAAKPAWSKTLFKSTQWQHLGDNTAIQGGLLTRDEVLKNVQALNADLASALVNLKKSSSLTGDSSGQEEAVEMDKLTLSASELLGKSKDLPEDVRKPIEEIAFVSLEILSVMKEDAKDRRQGIRYLSKYLPRAHHIVEEFTRMQKGMADETHKRTVEVLQRLADSFGEHRKSMDRNDTINFTAELDALDTLLRMRQR